MSVLVGGASTQSRVKRPLPPEWGEPRAIRRSGVQEDWQFWVSGKDVAIKTLVTFVFDQGGPVLGYTNSRNIYTKHIFEVVREAERQGMFGPAGIATEYEHMAAELLVSIVGRFIRGSDDLAMRWFANGSDACDAAIRLAKAATGRQAIISCGYHGSSIWFAHPPQDAGTPKALQGSQMRIDVQFGDSDQLARAMQTKPAAFIVEVPSVDDDAKSYLQYARQLADQHGVVLILDEVVTGFRLALGGAAERYGVEPDLACYGKAMSNGRAISAVVGRRAITELLLERVFYSNTYNGDPWNCAHVVGTLETLQEQASEIYPWLYELGETLRDGLTAVGVPTVGHGPRSAIVLEDYAAQRFSKEMARRGFVMNRPNYIAMGHTLYMISKAVKAAEQTMQVI